MGYTHYFAYDPTAHSFLGAWPRMVADARLIAWHVRCSLEIPLANGVGEGKPELTERRVWLNGPNEDDLGHETFRIDPTPWKLSVSDKEAAAGHAAQADRGRADFDRCGFITGFCKTARKPYDIAVTSILLRCRHLAPDAFLIASDGAWQFEWHHGAMHWHQGCRTGPSPVMLVRALFGQAETVALSQLADVLDGPPSVWMRRGRRVLRSG